MPRRAPSDFLVNGSIIPNRRPRGEAVSLKTQKQGQIGVNVVERIVLKEWGCRWQALDAHNDDAVDGLIFIERGGEMTGQVVFAQVKCIKRKLKKNGDRKISLNAKQLKRNMEIWHRVVGAVILILVDPDTLQAFWTDLRLNGGTSTQIFVPETQIFDRSAKELISQLCGNLHRDVLARKIRTEAIDFEHVRSREHIQPASRKLYLSLRNDNICIGGSGPSVIFDRHGWRHITRRERPELTRYQSFILLGCVRKILQATPRDDFQDYRPKGRSSEKLIVARAAVSFTFRQTAIVKVVLKEIEPEKSYRFHTVYEPRRRRNVLGAQEPLSP
ncbi:DUF4365 domain-containing protein [Bosea sp. RCC_152_1]|uniref:DUF4365 domain-containing protein n=1 Tax=Bosea sp. RCC_152_1 TaxID=3239228 RepID=UPI0035239A66